MGTTRHDGPDGLLLDEGAGPAVPRLLLGTTLQRLRETRGLSREDAGRTIRASGSKLCRLELGRTGCKPRDVADLLTLYGVTDKGERASILALADKANTPGWWQPYSDVIPPWNQPYLGLEQAAKVIRGFEVQFVPGLLQTPEYARAVTRLGHSRAPQEEIERRVELRMLRQRVLHRREPPQVWAVIDEAVLRRAIGGGEVMRGQLRHLIDLCDLPHMSIQVLPFEAGGHAAAGGPIALLRLPGTELPDVIYLEQLASAVYPDKPVEVLRYRQLMDRLATEASPPADTRTLLHWILDET